MSIVYEDNSSCLSCWDYKQPVRPAATTALYHPVQPRQKPNKISLKKYQLPKPPGLYALPSTIKKCSVSEPMHSTNHIQGDYSGHLRLPQDNAWRHPGVKLIQSRPLSSEPIVYITEAHCKGDNISKPMWAEELSQDRSYELSRTTKMQNANFLQVNELEKTRKAIPKVNKSLLQMSKMKHSVISILGPEEHPPRVDQSTILIDFFKPNSQITQLNQSAVPKR